MADEHHSDDDTGSQELPEAVIDEAERLTRRARNAVDDNEAAAYRETREELLSPYEFTARVRNENSAVLVLYPTEWVESGTVHPDQIDDIDRGIERRLEGVGDADDWETIRRHNHQLVESVESEYGEIHGANAQALADFMNNHYAKQIEEATDQELTEFLREYYPRNSWPSDDQKAVVEKSIEFVFEYADGESIERVR